MTNKGSNILEDLETLRLLAKVVPEYVPSMDEEGVSAAAFELLFAFDEVRRAWAERYRFSGFRRSSSAVSFMGLLSLFDPLGGSGGGGP